MYNAHLLKDMYILFLKCPRFTSQNGIFYFYLLLMSEEKWNALCQCMFNMSLSLLLLSCKSKKTNNTHIHIKTTPKKLYTVVKSSLFTWLEFNRVSLCLNMVNGILVCNILYSKYHILEIISSNKKSDIDWKKKCQKIRSLNYQ